MMRDQNVTVSIIDPAKPWMQATRDIQAGEELFFSYRIGYWSGIWLNKNRHLWEKGVVVVELFDHLHRESRLPYNIKMLRSLKQRLSTLNELDISKILGH